MVCSCFLCCKNVNTKLNGSCVKVDMVGCSNFILKSEAESNAFVLEIKAVLEKFNSINAELKKKVVK
jgi:hypothetical protein